MSSITTPLFELVRYQHELQILADSGEVPPEQIADTLQALDGDIKDKAVQVAAFSKNLDATAQAVREAAKAMLARADRIEKRAESIRSYLQFEMQAAQIPKIESPWFTLSLRKNPPAVVIDDEAAIPPEYIVQPPPPAPRPDRDRIRRDIKAGKAVPGCHLLATERLEIKC
jgi:Siphovirus Gp157.